MNWNIKRGVEEMKKMILGVGLLICGTICVSTQRVVDSIFVAANWQLHASGFNSAYLFGGLILLLGLILCVIAIKDQKE